MSNAIHSFNTRACPDLAALCSSFSVKQLQSPTRSTVPLIDLVYNGSAAWAQFLTALGAPRDCAVAFEFGVPSPKAGGNPSQTDAVFASASTVWAVEAKWTEPLDRQTVAVRIAKPETDGGDPRLTVAGWLKYLELVSTTPLHRDDFSDISYQMVHRAASAVWLAQSRQLKAELIYLHFAPSPDPKAATTAHYVAELTRLYQRLGRPGSLPIKVVEISLGYTREYEAIRGLDKHSPATSARVAAALCAGPLFTFSAPRVFAI